MNWKAILESEAFWMGLTVAIGYLANTVISRKLVSKLPPTSPARRAIRVLHGFLDKIDPPAALVLLACGSLLLPLCSGCAATKTSLPSPLDAAKLAFNTIDPALEAAVLAAPNDQLAKLKPAVDKMPAILEALKTGQDVCTQVAELGAVSSYFSCDDCKTALKVAEEVCR